MSQEGSSGGFEQASADAERLAAELAEIRTQLTALREQNAKFLATDPITGKTDSGGEPAAQKAPADAKTAAATPSGEKAESAEAPMGPPAKEPKKDPQMANAGQGGAATSAPSDDESGKKRWWRKQKPAEHRETGFESPSPR